MAQVTIVGGGLAGSEAAWQLAQRGVRVRLHEMRPEQLSKAHKTGKLAELVCSNSLRGRALTNAVGVLKEELRLCDSLIMRAATVAEVPAGGAWAVDREKFSEFIDETLRAHPLVEIVTGEMREIPPASPSAPVIVATGPLTSPALSAAIDRLLGATKLAFFDAISPIILGASIDLGKVFRQSRYQKGSGDDYLNVPLDKEQYERFVADVSAAEKFGGHEEVEGDMVADLRPFEGCMPIEEMVARGAETLRYGPLKPIGLIDPATGKRPHAVVQLRQDNQAGTLWSMVGMQTRMRHGEQERIFRALPGLERAEFVRLGTVHRNTFINSPACLEATMQLRTDPALFFAGQITGVEGYVESTASGLLAGINAGRVMRGQEPVRFPDTTMIGALAAYVSDPGRKFFQPMNISFGLVPSYSASFERRMSKDDRRLEVAQAALAEVARVQLSVGSGGAEALAAGI